MAVDSHSNQPNGSSQSSNGVKHADGPAATLQQNGSIGNTLQIWGTVNQYLPSRNADYDFWWQLTGRHLAIMLAEASTPIKEQYEALMFHYHWVVPVMGPKPGPNGIIPGQWKSLLQADGTPMEYSWKWNSSRGRPAIRYAMEPLGPNAGTELDPLNQQATRDIMYRLSQVFPAVDLQWTSHFFSALFDHDYARFAQEAAAGDKPTTSTGIGVEFGPNGPGFKSYFQGRKLGQPGFMPLDQWLAAMRPLLTSDASNGVGGGALDELLSFLQSHPENQDMKPFSLAVDCVKPEKSRLKLYLNTPHTSFDSVRRTLTLGGRISGDVVEKQLQDLRELLYGLLDLPEDFANDTSIEQTYHRKSLLAETASAPPERSEAGRPRVSSNGSSVSSGSEGSPPPPAHTPGFVYYFDVAKDQKLPKIKLNIPVRSYGRDDLGTARALTKWMEARGRGQFAENYITMLEGLASSIGKTQKGLGQTRGLQSFVSADLSSSGDLGVTSYMAVRGSDAIEGLNRSKPLFGRVRGTRRRDE